MLCATFQWLRAFEAYETKTDQWKISESVSPQELDYVQIDDALVDAAVRALEAAERAGFTVVRAAESCTGGLIATLLSEAPGAAEYVRRGVLSATRKRPRRSASTGD